MANTIEAVSIKNPFGYNDVCSHITTDSRASLTISNCMPYISTYAYQFWIKSNSAKTISFSCDTTFKQFDVTRDWQYFSVIFEVEKISNIHLEFPKGQFWIYNMKLEIGQYLTDWSPHPEDGISAYEEKFDNIEKLLAQHSSSIQNTISLVDKANQEILNSVSKTTFESEIIGVQNNFSDRFTNIEDGYGKWHVSIFDKSQFKNLYYNQEIEATDEETPSVTPSETEPTESTETEGGESPKPSSNETTTDPASALMNRECNDMSIFGLENANVVPSDELLIDDNPVAMRIDGKGKILYYLTFAKFSENTDVNVMCSHNKGTLYLNGISKLSSDNLGTDVAQLNFSKGWNIIEIVTNEGNFSINTPISEHPNCVLFNCLMGVPTSRTTKIREQGASLNIYLDKIVSEVFDINQETKDGVVSRKIESSKIQQNAQAISFVVTRGDSEDGSSTSEFKITPDAVKSITPQLIIEGLPGTGQTIIEGGHINAHSITAKMLSTNAIMSENFKPHAVPPVIDPVEGGPDDEGIHYDENEPQYSQEGTFIDLANGNIYTPSLYIKNANDPFTEESEAYFRGNIYANNGRFNGRITSSEGLIGGWNINNQGIWRGDETFASGTSQAMYLGKMGISLGGNKLVYTSEGDNLKLNIDALSIVGKPTDERILKSGVRLYSKDAAPTTNKEDYPLNTWIDINTYADHVGDIYLDNSTGQTYIFKRSSDARYKIKFHADSALRPARDYIQIFYTYEKTMHKVTPIITAEFGEDEIIIPTENFYVYLHIGDPTSGMDDKFKFGFEIESVEPLEDLETEVSRNIALQNLPSYPVDASLVPGEYPKTSHPYTQALYNKIWYCRAISDDVTFYEWEPIDDVDLTPSTEDLAEALSYLHYDIQNGLILYNNTSTDENDEHIRKALPSKILNKKELDSIVDGNIRLNSSGLEIYNGNTLLASYGDTINLYKDGAVIASYGDSTNLYQVELVQNPDNPDELIKQSFPVTTIDSDGLTFYKVAQIYDPDDPEKMIKTTFPVVTYGDSTIFYKVVYVQDPEDPEKLVMQSIPVTTIDEHGLNIKDGTIKLGDYFSVEDGNVFIGNRDGSYINYDENGLILNVSKLYIGNQNNTAIEDLLGESEKYAKNYLYYDETMGLIMHGINGYPSDIQTALETAGPNIRLRLKNPQDTTTTYGLGIYYNNQLLANYGEKVEFYKIGTTDIATTLDADGLNISSGSITLGDFTDYNSTGQGFYLGNDGKLKIGNDDSYILFDGENITMRVKSVAIGGTDVNPEDPNYDDQFADAGATATNYLYYDGSGLYIHRKDGFNSKEISNVVDPYVKLTADALEIYKNKSKLAEYGASTKFYIPGTSTVATEIDSDGMEINYGSISIGTSFSVTNTGYLTASSGKIGSINIGSSSIYSGYHSTYNSGNSGFYLGSDGTFGVGDSNSYITYDGSKVTIQVESLSLKPSGGTSSPVVTQADLTEALKDIGDGGSGSGSSTSSYLTYIASSNNTLYPAGLYVHAENSYQSGSNLLLGTNTIKLRNGSWSLVEINSNTSTGVSQLTLKSTSYSSTFETTQSGMSLNFNNQTYPAIYDSGVSCVYLGTTANDYYDSNGKPARMVSADVKGTLTCGTLSCSSFNPTSISPNTITVSGNSFFSTGMFFDDGVQDFYMYDPNKTYSKSNTLSDSYKNYFSFGYITATSTATTGSRNMHIGAHSAGRLSNSTQSEGIDNLYLHATSSISSTSTINIQSDRRLKNSIEDIQNYKEFIMSIEPKIFKYNISEKYHTGFIAQNVQDVVNSTIKHDVIVNSFKSDEDSDKEYLSVAYEEIIAPHVAVTQEHEYRIQEQDEEIQELKSEVADLKEQVNLLLKRLGDK